MIKQIIVFLIILMLPNLMFSQYYADIIINLEDNGAVSIEGKTNYDKFILAKNSQKYTSKEGEYWILNISTKEKFSNFIYELKLPANAEINYMKTTPNFRIENEDNKITIIGTGEDKPFTLIVQYKITITEDFLKNNLINYGLIGIIILLGAVISLIVKKSRTKNLKEKELKINDKIEIEDKVDLTILPQRQQDIISILKSRGKITQKELEKQMEIPKSSISRNIQTLVIKGIIKKEQVGVTNYISLKNQEKD